MKTISQILFIASTFAFILSVLMDDVELKTVIVAGIVFLYFKIDIENYKTN